MSESDLVSIVIPTYNRANLIKYAIDSALSQVYKNIEVVVVDDGSTDNTRMMCAQYGDKIRYFYKQNEGMVVASNYGIKMMKGSWFKYLADDDLLHPDAIRVLMEHANNSRLHVIYSDHEFIDEEGNTIGIWANKHFDNYYELALEVWLQHALFGTFLIHRSCFETVGNFDSSYGTAFDSEWLMRICLLYDYMFYHVPKTLYKFRVHKQQASIVNIPSSLVWLKQMRENIKKEMMEKYPQRWSLFESYLKDHRRALRGKELSIKHIMRRMVPYGLRNYYRRFRNKIILSRYEVKCEYCKFFGKNTYMYLTPNTDYLVCQNCGIHYTSENVKKLMRSCDSKLTTL